MLNQCWVAPAAEEQSPYLGVVLVQRVDGRYLGPGLVPTCIAASALLFDDAAVAGVFLRRHCPEPDSWLVRPC